MLHLSGVSVIIPLFLLGWNYRICSEGLRRPSRGTVYMSVFPSLKHYSCYDVLPQSFKVIVFDQTLVVKKAFLALLQHGVQSAVVFASTDQTFVGMLTVTDFIHLIVYYYTKHTPLEQALEEIDSLTIETMRTVLAATPDSIQKVISCSPDATLYEAGSLLVSNKLHRLILLDESPQQDIVVSVLTHYKILRFVACNVFIILYRSRKQLYFIRRSET